MPVFLDRVRETSLSSGSSNITLAGAVTGFRSFNTAFGTSAAFTYGIETIDSSGVPTGDWEIGVGYLSDAITLVRNQVTASSNGGSAVSLSTANKNVFCTFNGGAGTEVTCNDTFDYMYGTP